MAKVLIIDDSRYARLKIAQFLRTGGFDIAEASDGAMGIEQMHKEKPDCIVCDLLMPEMDGFAFLEKLKEQGVEIPVVVVTSDIQNTTERAVMQLGAHAVITKLSDGSAVLKAINEAVSSRRKS